MIGGVEFDLAARIHGVESEVLRARDERQERAQGFVDPIDAAAALEHNLLEIVEAPAAERGGGVARPSLEDAAPEAHHAVDRSIRPQSTRLHHAQHRRIVARHRAILPLVRAVHVIRQVVRRRGGRSDTLPEAMLAAPGDGVVNAVPVIIHHLLGVLVISEEERRGGDDADEGRHHEHLGSAEESRVDKAQLAIAAGIFGGGEAALLSHERLEEGGVVLAEVPPHAPRLLHARARAGVQVIQPVAPRALLLLLGGARFAENLLPEIAVYLVASIEAVIVHPHRHRQDPARGRTAHEIEEFVHALARALLQPPKHLDRRHAADTSAVHAQNPNPSALHRFTPNRLSHEFVLAQDGQRARRHAFHLRVHLRVRVRSREPETRDAPRRSHRARRRRLRQPRCRRGIRLHWTDRSAVHHPPAHDARFAATRAERVPRQERARVPRHDATVRGLKR